MASEALKFPYITQPQQKAQWREAKHRKEDGCSVSSAFFWMGSMQPLARSFPAVKKAVVETTAACIPLPLSPDILMTPL